jgi:putative spermidine/putrescine transport system ATP-binding protein
MQLELKNIQHQTGTTTIAVTHDQIEAMSMADAVAIMNDGRLVQVGSPEEVYRRPADLFVARFLGEANLIPLDGDRLRAFRTPVSAGVADPIAVVRPEDIELVSADTPGAAQGRIQSEVFQGARRRLAVSIAGIDQPLIVSARPQQDAPSPADGAVALRLRVSSVHTVSTAGLHAPVPSGGQADPDLADTESLISQ